jgi:parallel beta-helix repeat protein
LRKRTASHLILIITLFFLASHSTPLIPLAKAGSTTWFVPGDFATIQEAVDASNSGDTILVALGTYHEHLSISKSNLTLIGESSLTTVIDGNQTSSVVFLNAKNVTLKGFKIQNGIFGINMVQSKNCTISDNVVTLNTDEGMRIWWESSNNTITGNTVVFNNGYGIRNMLNSNENTIANNTVADNEYGMTIANSMSALLKNNSLANNTYNFGVQGGYPYEFIHNIDLSNTVNGKPIIYLENQTDLTIDPSTYPAVGYLALINSRNITMKNLNISNNVQGILIENTTNSIIQYVDVSNNLCGIQLLYANNNCIRNNTLQPSLEETTALYLMNAKFNTVTNNRITSNYKGIHLIDYATNNTITGNTLTDNSYAMFVQVYSSGNIIYHNNFINNADQVSSSWSNNTWDNGYPSGGNYWSDYSGDDLDSDGIGDVPYTIDLSNQDRYPLMDPEGGEEFTNIAVTNVTATPTEAYEGETVNILVTVSNQALTPQTLNVTAYYDNDPIETQTINNLAPNTDLTTTIYWNTANATPQSYTIKAVATQVPGETNLNDNTYVDGTVNIKITGDVNGDGQVDVADLTIVSIAFGNFEGEPDYNPIADLNHDGVVDMRDLAKVARHLGETA